MTIDISLEKYDPFQKFFLPGFWLLYTVFVIYGSLVPLTYEPMPFDRALMRFADIPYLNIDMYGREDWIANMVLYVPMAYFGCMVWMRGISSRIVLSLWVVIICGSVAISVEFAQLYFRRTVSLNDLIAEVLGTLIGVGVFLLFGRKMIELWRFFWSEGKNAVRAGLVLYTLIFFMYTLFPFDFLISLEELYNKLELGGYSLWMIKTRMHSTVFAFKLMAEIAMVMPLGSLLAVFGRWRFKTSGVIIIGAALGLGIECIQFFLVSGMSQGISILLKAVGFALGYWMTDKINTKNLPLLIGFMRRNGFVTLWWVLFLIGLIAANWVHRGPLISISEALNRLENISFLPFFYHYRMSESRALLSAVGYFVMYFPVGVLICLRGVSYFEYIDKIFISRAFVLAGGLAACFEFGKLFLSHARPDVTNLIIGPLGAVMGCIVVYWVQKVWSLEIRRALYKIG